MKTDIVSLATAAAALVGVIGLILGAGRIARHRLANTPAAGRRLRLAETIALDPRRRLHLLECDGRKMLLLTGGAGDILLRLNGDDDQRA